MISICSAYAVVYVPIEFAKYPGYETDFSWPSYAYIGKSKYKSSADELKDYWTTFKDTFSRSYKEILAADIVERVVPVPVPGKICFFSLSKLLFSIV